jgi:hypothetical protein
MYRKIFKLSELKNLNSETFPPPVFQKKLSKPKVDKETGKTEQVSYYSANLSACYKDKKSGEVIKCDQIFVEGPLLETANGIYTKKNNDAWGASILVQLPLSNSELDSFAGPPIDMDAWESMPEETTTDSKGKTIPGKDSVGFMQQLRYRCLDAAFLARGGIEIRGVRNKDGFEPLFKNPLRWQTNPETGIIREGTDPAMYINLKLYGNPLTAGQGSKAVFSMPVTDTSLSNTGELTIDWKYLTNAKIQFRPVFYISSVTCAAGKLSIKIQMVSAVVHSFEPSVADSMQRETIRALAQDTTVVSKLAQQYRAMQLKIETEEKKQRSDSKDSDLVVSSASPNEKTAEALAYNRKLASALLDEDDSLE